MDDKKRRTDGKEKSAEEKEAGSGKKENLHVGHRERLRGQVEKNGFNGMPDHVILEYLLFYTIPRRDTNETAHRLIDRFGSLAGVLDADVRDLLNIKGVGPSTARFLKVFPMVGERYAHIKFKGNGICRIEKLGRFLVDYFSTKTEEEVFVFFLDNSGGLIGREVVYHGSINSTYVSPRGLLDAICRTGAVSVILSHNHPSGDAKPSEEDISLTRRLMDAFIPFGITIKAHLVVARDRFTDVIPLIYKDINVRPRYIAVRSPAPCLPETSKNSYVSDRVEELPDPAEDGCLSALYEKYGVNAAASGR